MADQPNFLFDTPDNPKRGTSAGWQSVWPPSYNAKYPFNNVRATPAGHLFEMDDTPGHERIQLFHRSGARIELRPDGSVQYISAKSRQDVTLGDNLVSVHGDYNLSVGGKGRIRISGGDMILECPEGMAINAKGAELKIDAKNIHMTADGKIALSAPSVDIGGGGPFKNMPYLQLPYGVVPIFGVLVPRITSIFGPESTPISTSGLSQALTLTANEKSTTTGIDDIKTSGTELANNESTDTVIKGIASSTAFLDLGGIAKQLTTLASTLKSVVQQINDIKTYAKSVGRGISLLKELTDAKGDKIIPEIKDPEILPLKSPKTYYGANPSKITFRDRQFDTPEDVSDTTRYTAHLSISEKLGDFTPEQKNLPGQIFDYDEALPVAEPRPFWPFAVSGTLSGETNSQQLLGSGTIFEDELEVGQTIRVNNKFVEIVAVADNNTLIISPAWEGGNFSGASAVVYRFRRFGDYAGQFDYPRSTPLGASGKILEDFLRDFIPPVVEKETAAPGMPDEKIPTFPITPPPPTSYTPPEVRVLPRRIRLNESALITITNYESEVETYAVYGYFITTSPTHVLTFASGTTATSTITLNLARGYNPAGLSDISTYGYISGGGGAPSTTEGTERLTYATQILATYTAGNLTTPREATAGLSDSVTYGYVAGGNGPVATSERLSFATGTYTLHGSSLSQARYDVTSLSDGETYGYFAGGQTSGLASGVVATTDRIAFSSGAIAAHTPANFSVITTQATSVSDNSTYGYFAGGNPNGSTPPSPQYMEKLTFSTSINQATTTTLPEPRDQMMSATDGKTYGYFTGGAASGPIERSSTFRLTYATGTLATHTPANLTTTKSGYQGISDFAV